MSCDTPISANLAAIYEIIKIVRAVCPEGSESDENTFDPSKVKESVRIAACLKILNYPSTHEKVKEVITYLASLHKTPAVVFIQLYFFSTSRTHTGGSSIEVAGLSR
jgi:hypothetical protein